MMKAMKMMPSTITDAKTAVMIRIMSTPFYSLKVNENKTELLLGFMIPTRILLPPPLISILEDVPDDMILHVK